MIASPINKDAIMEVILNNKQISLDSRKGRGFLKDFYKTMQQKLTVAELRLKYQITAETIKNLADDPAFIDALRASQEKRKQTNNIVELRPQPTIDNTDLITDMCRYSEGILDQQAVRKMYRLLGDDIWEKLGQDDVLVEKIEDKRIRRIRNGQARREKSQLLAMKAPDVLSSILLNPSANPKHRTDAAVVLDRFATPPAQAAAADLDRIIIQINLGADSDGKEVVQKFNKARAPVIDDPDDPDNIASQDLLAIVASNKPTDDGNGDPI